MAWAFMAVRWDVSHVTLSLFVTCSIAKNRNKKKYSLNATPESPVTSSAPTTINMTNIDQKLELGNPDLSTVIENKSQDILAEATAL